MTDKPASATNVFFYCFGKQDEIRKQIAKGIVSKSKILYFQIVNRIVKVQMKKFIRTLLILIFILNFTIDSSTAQNGLKRAGVCFRVDDNQPYQKWIDYSNVFNKYGAKFCFSLNLGLIAPNDSKYLNTIKGLMANSHEMMDHTPNHQTYGFTVRNLSDTILFSKQPGVDHINKYLVCLKIKSINKNTDYKEGLVSLDGNQMISINPGEFKKFDQGIFIGTLAIYFPQFDELYSYYGLKNKNSFDPDTLFLQSFWYEQKKINFKGIINYKKLLFKDIVMDPQGISLLFKQTSTYCKEFGLLTPKTWIQPGGYFPQFTPNDIKFACDSWGYTAAGIQINSGLQYFDEYDPDKSKRFSLWGDNFNLETSSFKAVKTLIADGIAKHKVMIGVGHFGAYTQSPLTGGWNSYLQKTDSLLSWCKLKDIPIRTYKEWTPILFDSIQNPYQNIFPPLNIDLDENVYPDGFNLKDIGKIYTEGGVPLSKGYYINRSTTGFLCSISNLGGLEKGINQIEFYIRGNPKDSIYLNINYDQNGAQKRYYIKTNTVNWSKRRIEFVCPETISTITLYFYGPMKNFNTDISGITLRKKSILIADPDTTLFSTVNLKIKGKNIKQRVKENFYSMDSLHFTIIKPSKLIASFDPLKNLVIHKPTPFWQGSDEIHIKVENPDNSRDTINLKYVINEPLYYQNDTIDLQPDFNTPPDIVTFSSIPYDPTLTLTSNYNYKAIPKVNTTYIIEGKYKNGNIIKDSLHIKLNQRPVSTISLFGNNPICDGGSSQLIANNTPLKTEWYFNDNKILVADTTHSISAKLPGKYSVIQTDQFGTRVKSNNIVIEEFPSISIKTQKKIITCATHPFFVQINCINTDSIKWSVVGDGSITKLFNHNILYSPGLIDLKSGKSVLKYAAYGFNNCKTITDSIVVYFKNPILSQPVLKQGEIIIPQNQFEYTRYIVDKKNADTISWTIEPKIAATLVSNDSICDIYWNNKISDQVKLKAIATNKCGYMATSIFSVNLKNLTNSSSAIEEGIVDFTFTPNPVIHGAVLIKLNKYPIGTQKLKLYNQVGMLLLEKSMNYNSANGTFPLNLASFPDGIYFIQIGNQTKKIMIL